MRNWGIMGGGVRERASLTKKWIGKGWKPTPVVPVAWLVGWSYHSLITIEEQSGSNLENYPVLVELNSTNFNFEDAQSNGEDIRFTDDRATLIDYWIEEWDNTSKSAMIWVEVPSVSASETKVIYMYYGNSSASSASNGTDTFEFFDDFFSLGFNPVISPSQSWESGGQNRWGTIALVGSTYYIYFTNGSEATSDVGRAISTDLIGWTKYSGNPVINNIIGPSLLKELDGKTPVVNASKYWMTTCTSTGSKIQVRSASAIGSNTWTVETDEAITPQAETWYSSMVFTNSFVKEGSTYYIVFQGYDGTYWKTGYATASAPGGPYTVQGILLSPSLGWEGIYVIDPEMRKFGSTYYLFYTGNGGTSCRNSYATASSITGPFTKSEILLTPTGISYPAILLKDSIYYMLTDDLNTEKTGKNLYTRADLDGAFSDVSAVWDIGREPTISSGELLINAQDPAEYITSKSTFQYKALKARVKFPATAISYHYFGFQASAIASSSNTEMFFTYDTPDLRVWSGDADGWEDTSIYNAAYFGSYHDYEILWKSGEAKFYIDGILKDTDTAQVCDSAQPVGFYGYVGPGDMYADWIFVRKYISPEPLVSVTQ